MSLHRYPRSILVQDDLRAAAGLAVTVGVLSVARLPDAVIYVFVALTALFAAFAVRTIARHFAVLEVSEAGVRTTGPAGGSIDWEELQDLRLRYYSTRRDRENGWMHLKIKGRHATIRIDSSIEGFDRIVERMAAEAARRRIQIGDSTRSNWAAMGIATE